MGSDNALHLVVKLRYRHGCWKGVNLSAYMQVREYLTVVQRRNKRQRSQVKWGCIFLFSYRNVSLLLCGFLKYPSTLRTCTASGPVRFVFFWSLAQLSQVCDKKGNSSVRFFSTSGCNCHQYVFSVNEAFSALSHKWKMHCLHDVDNCRTCSCLAAES